VRITVSLDTGAVITQPSPARAKAGGVVPVEVAFTRGSQVVMLPEHSTIEFVLKTKNTWTGGMLVYHSGFAAGAGSIYVGPVNFSTEPLLAALGLTDNAPANDIGQIEAACEIIWNIGTQKFRSATFALTVESPLAEAIIIPPADPTLYPSPEEIEVIARKGQPGGYAGLDLDGKVPPAQLPLTGAILRDTSPMVHSGGGDWDMGPNIILDGCYALVVQWTFVCKFNTSPMLAMEVYGGTSTNPLIVKPGSGCTLIKLG